MKKKLALIALCVSALFAFSACSVQIKTEMTANWHKNQSYDSAYYELLEYGISFTPTEDSDSGITIELDEANSSYTVMTEALSGTDLGLSVTNIYHIHTELKVAASYVAEKDGQKTVIAAFGGENGEPDTLISDVYFRSLENGNNLEPRFSTLTVRSHSLTNATADSLSSRSVWLFNYQVSIDYSLDCTQATVFYIDNHADIPDEERQVSDYVVKASLTSTQERTYDKLQKNYSVFDAAQLYFMGRGITFGEETSQTVTTVSEAGKNTVTLSCTELSSLSRTFELDGQAADTNSSFAVAKVKFSIQNGDIYTGQARTVTYAQKTSGAENTLYNLPVQIEEPLAYNMGSYIYSLKSASHTR